MIRDHRPHLLAVAIRPGMIIRPENARGVSIIVHAMLGPRVRIVGVEMMRPSRTADLGNRATEVHVIASDQQAAAALVEAADSGLLIAGEPLSSIDRKQP